MELTENYIVAQKKKKSVVIHSTLPFKDFVSLLDILFDSEYIGITEISENEFHYLYTNTECSAYHIDKESFQGMIKRLNNK